MPPKRVKKVAEEEDTATTTTTTTAPAPKPKPAPKGKATKRTAADVEAEVAEDTGVAAPAAKAARVEVPKSTGARPKVDQYYRGAGQVYQDEAGNNWSVMLNQTNIGGNNNKYYVIQLIENGKSYTTFTRWGRVGEPGQNASSAGSSLEAAKKEFANKFKDKTKNSWDDVRQDNSKFKKFPDKYLLVETVVDDSEDTAQPAVVANAAGEKVLTKPCTLHSKLQDMLRVIFDKDMFKNQMVKQKIDANRMPLGKLSKAQIEKGYAILNEIDKEVKSAKPNRTKLSELSGNFYSTIPHDFGRSVPPVIGTASEVDSKAELLNILNDIQIAVAMDANAAAKSTDELHPLDKQYNELNCELVYVDPKSDEFKIIQEYTQATQGRKCEITNVFRMDRPQDKKRMEAFKQLDNRRLLWHGTNIAVVAAILKTGLRIMPHAGGRVGKGLYFASENGKSAGYVGTDNHVGFMFLNEVALGKIQEINQDDSSLTRETVTKRYGSNSIIARGRTEPDPSKDVTIDGEWGPIAVPQGKPIPQSKWHNSTFSQSEFLVYDEGQVRMKYVLQMKFPGY